MSPTLFCEGPYRFLFFSREEARMRVHVISPGGEAKFWLVPAVALARNYRLTGAELREVERIIEVHYDDIVAAWRRHFHS